MDYRVTVVEDESINPGVLELLTRCACNSEAWNSTRFYCISLSSRDTMLKSHSTCPVNGSRSYDIISKSHDIISICHMTLYQSGMTLYQSRLTLYQGHMTLYQGHMTLYQSHMTLYQSHDISR